MLKRRVRKTSVTRATAVTEFAHKCRGDKSCTLCLRWIKLLAAWRQKRSSRVAKGGSSYKAFAHS